VRQNGIARVPVLAETAGDNFCSDPRARVANALRQRAHLQDMPERKLLGFLSVRGCDRAFDAACTSASMAGSTGAKL
jgi:hypothetical protein